jgi:hypothetical protein
MRIRTVMLSGPARKGLGDKKLHGNCVFAAVKLPIPQATRADQHHGAEGP